MSTHRSSFLVTDDPQDCFGCEACREVCPVFAVEMQTDTEGFRYPAIDMDVCIHCKRCEVVCPVTKEQSNTDTPLFWGGSHKDPAVLADSTSGGAFTALVQAHLKKPHAVVWGAACTDDPLTIEHICIDSLEDLSRLRRSKYVQSSINGAFRTIKRQLKEGKQVLFSGTPCQTAALKSFIGTKDSENLVLVEVICEGVPAPAFIQKYTEHLAQQQSSEVVEFDWRYKYEKRWDFQFMRVAFSDGTVKKFARWFSSFWNIWLRHLMTRPSCYSCPYAKRERTADITIADLWGVHIFCPELYAQNRGCSLVIASNQKGKDLFCAAQTYMDGHKLNGDDVIRYQGPMRSSISSNPQRDAFMADLTSDMPYAEITEKWAQKPSIKLLAQKYLWGNRQKVWLWNIFNRNVQ